MVYLYRAVDKGRNTVDFRLSDRRNVATAKAFFKKAIRHQSHAPHTLVKSSATHGTFPRRALSPLTDDGGPASHLNSCR